MEQKKEEIRKLDKLGCYQKRYIYLDKGTPYHFDPLAHVTEEEELDKIIDVLKRIVKV